MVSGLLIQSDSCQQSCAFRKDKAACAISCGTGKPTNYAQGIDYDSQRTSDFSRYLQSANPSLTLNIFICKTAGFCHVEKQNKKYMLNHTRFFSFTLNVISQQTKFQPQSKQRCFRRTKTTFAITWMQNCAHSFISRRSERSNHTQTH